MNRRDFLVLSSATLFTGCASDRRAIFAPEEFAVAAWNAGGREIEDIVVADKSRPNVWWFSQLKQRPHPAWPNIPPSQGPGFGGNFRSGRIPDAVTVQWREMPPSGGKPYTGKLVGPFPVLGIRSRIPPDILRMAREERYVLNITFTSGVEPVRFDWMLERYSPDGRGGPKEIARGGDSIE
jgi:hypothetical protein